MTASVAGRFSAVPRRQSTLASPDTAAVFESLGVAALRASVIHVDTMACESSWRITTSGEPDERSADTPSDSGFPTAMATIAYHNRNASNQTVKRRLDACRWGFAWRVGDKQVAVADVSYRSPHQEPSDADAALMRRLCNAGLQTTAKDAAHRSTLAEPSQAQAAELPAKPPAPRAVPDYVPGWLPARIALGFLLPVYLLAAGLLWAVQHRADMGSDAARLQARAHQTVQQRLGTTLAGGDYGEVQAELDNFAALKHFDSALVIGTRNRVVAMTGAPAGIRIGEVAAAESLAGSLALPLTGPAGELVGTVNLWGSAVAQSLNRAPWILGTLLVCLAVTVTAGWYVLFMRGKTR